MNTKKFVLILLGTVGATIILNNTHEVKKIALSLNTLIDTAHCNATYKWECDGYTPLMLAAMRGNFDDAKDLIERGASLDTLSTDIDQSTQSSNNFAMHNNTEAKYLHNTALHIAIYNTNFPANFPVAQMLIHAGANVRIHNSAGDTPMYFIMQRIYRIPALDAANLSEREDLLVNLIAHGADINAQNNQGYTMLHLAVFNGEGEWIKRLLTHYGSIVDFHAQSIDTSCDSLTGLQPTPGTTMTKEKCQRLTPLQLAGRNAGNNLGANYARSVLLNDVTSNPVVDEKLIKPIILGANDRDVMGMTGLMLGVIWEGTQKLKNPAYNASQDLNDPHRNFTVDKLIQDSSDINASVKCFQGGCYGNYSLENTVLHICLLQQLPDMIKALLEGAKKYGKNIDVNKQNINGDAPLHYVLKLNAQTIPMQTRARVNIADYSKQSRSMAIEYLMNYGGNINIQNKNGDTLLHLAVKAHAIDLINFLLQKYNTKELNQKQLINLSIRNNEGVQQGGRGKTALDLAQQQYSKATTTQPDPKAAEELKRLIAQLSEASVENQKLLSQLKG